MQGVVQVAAANCCSLTGKSGTFKLPSHLPEEASAPAAPRPPSASARCDAPPRALAPLVLPSPLCARVRGVSVALRARHCGGLARCAIARRLGGLVARLLARESGAGAWRCRRVDSPRGRFRGLSLRGGCAVANLQRSPWARSIRERPHGGGVAQRDTRWGGMQRDTRTRIGNSHKK